MSRSKTTGSLLAEHADFRIDPVSETTARVAAAAVQAPVLDPNLGPLVAFTGTWRGKGFNTIFRPQSKITPTLMPGPITTTDKDDNVLELNLTDEVLSFSKSLGNVPNRGSGNQADAFLNAVPYLQTINNITQNSIDPKAKIEGIHFEPGMWLAVPLTTIPNEPFTVARMASIPHGTTIVAQGVAMPPVNGKPTIAAVDITPFVGRNPGNKITFQNQTAANSGTRRIPQNLAPFIAAGTITQALLDDPNKMLRDQFVNQTIMQTIVIHTSTKPDTPLPFGPLPPGANPNIPPAIIPKFGGGTANIAFLLGLPNPPPGGVGSNSNAFQMDAVFWIETVVYDVKVPPLPAGSPPIVLEPQLTGAVPLVPNFVASIPFVPGKSFVGGVVKVATTQIQYSQKVMLDFFGLTWPHVSVATLVPADPIPIPAHLLPLT